MPKPVMLIILDGWGIREKVDGNAPLLGETPKYDHWLRTRERAVIDASEEAVGLIPGQMGNSEVGHLNLGAGRVVYQDITRINIAIRENTLRHMAPLQKALKTAQQGGDLHLVGLLGPGGVHSHQDHLHALLNIARDHEVNPVLHLITDGRDTPTTSSLGFLDALEAKIAEVGVGRMATVSGRYYAMDRDKRWERTRQAWEALVKRQGEHAATAREAIQQSHAQGVTDEFILPTVLDGGDADAGLAIKPGDAILFYNFRADRMRQIVQGFAIKGHDGFSEADFLDDLTLVTMTVYEDDLPVDVLFDKQILNNTLAEVLSAQGKQQYHSAETEKYPHVTYFFNGRSEEPHPREDWHIVPSPKVATYDLKPDMSAYDLRDATLKRLQESDDDFILINFANPDMVGHTGSLEAAIKAVEAVDACAGALVEAVQRKGGYAIVTSDHGNCERMIEHATGEAHTYHTTNPVGLFVIGEGYIRLRPRGKLADIAPTVLHLLGIDAPPDMTGESLIDFGPV